MKNNNATLSSIKILEDRILFKNKMTELNLELISFYEKQIEKHTKENETFKDEIENMYEDIQKIKPS